MKKFLLGFGVSLLLLGCQSSQDILPEDKTPLKIGAIVPLTGDGASYGVLVQDVANLIVDPLNTAGGINGRTLKIVWEDGKCAPSDASRSAQKLIGIDKVSIILGGVCSGETLGAAPITEKNKVILLSPVSTSPEVTTAGDYVFRTAPSDSSQGKVLAEYANAHFKKIGILGEQTDYALGVANTFEENFTGEVLRESYLSTESDFRTRITKLKNADIEAVLLIPQTYPKFDIIAKQLDEQAWSKPILTNEIITGDGGVSNYVGLLTRTNAIGANFKEPDTPSFKKMVSDYNGKYSKNPDLLNYAATTADAVNVLIQILKQTADSTDTESIKNALYGLNGFEGMYGPIVFDSNGDVNIAHQLFSFDGEKFVPLAE
ncbi:ABC transporter substrate-binding protein [Candidatus Gracilibacteria bacterium]|nr:ABC transporter substrate-binding protein [Candidatus Gracilibacteria bacterium]